MKLTNIIKRLFSRKKSYTTTISNFSDLITLPTREELKNNEEKIAMLNQFKKTYHEKLSTRKTIVSSQLEIDSLRDKMNMYINIILSLFETDELNSLSLNVSNYDEDSAKNFFYFLKMAKLKLYFYNILSLENETTLRLVALKELNEELPFLSRLKKRPIAEEINNLSATLLVFLNQRQAISLELENYLKEYSLLKAEEQIPQKELSKLIIEKYKELLRMLTLISPYKEKIFSSKEPDLTTLVLMEQDLETYVYTHKGEVEDIRKMLFSLTEETKNQVLPEDIQSKVENLELKCKIFSEYGRKTITDDDIYTLYNLKFSLLTRDLITKDLDLEKIVDNANFLELSLYQEIIMNKINAIVMGNNAEITRLFGKNAPAAIRLITSVLKDGQSEYAPDKILKRKLSLCLLVSFDRPNGIFDFFENYQVTRLLEPLKEHQGHTDYFFSLFVWADKLPLNVIYELMYFNESIKNPDENLIHFEYAGLYKLYVSLYKPESPSRNKVYKLPEGIRKIKEFDPIKISIPEKNLIKKIHQASICKTLIFPATLREINGNLFRHCYIENIVLNKGLKKITRGAFHAVDFDTLTIPSSVCDIDYATFNTRNTNELRTDKSRFDDLILDDIYESQLTDESITNLVRAFFYVEADQPVKIEEETLENNRIKWKNGNSNDYTTCPSQKREVKNSTFEVFPVFERLIIRENGEEILILTKKDLTFLIHRLFEMNPAVIGEENYYQHSSDYYIESIDEDGPCFIIETNDAYILSTLEARQLTKVVKEFLKDKLNKTTLAKPKILTKEKN